MSYCIRNRHNLFYAGHKLLPAIHGQPEAVVPTWVSYKNTMDIFELEVAERVCREAKQEYRVQTEAEADTGFPPGYNPRIPTKQEYDAILACEAAYCGTGTEEIGSPYIAIFDTYISDGPGYCGKVALSVSAGLLGCTASYTFDITTKTWVRVPTEC